MEGEGAERAKVVALAIWAKGEGAATVAAEILLLLLLTVLLVVLRVVPAAAEEVGVGISTCFLERLRPRCMWRSQYLCPATTSLEHLHFLPSVLLHRPGSGSIAPLPQYPDCNADHTYTYTYYITTSGINILILKKWNSFKLSGEQIRIKQFRLKNH